MAIESYISVSVVVCTYNRPQLLGMCLESLVGQNCDSCRYEVIVVNNGSSDNTQEIIDYYRNGYTNVRGVYEAAQGLSHARNRGWREAEGIYVAFIDDDAVAGPEWVGSIMDFIGRRPDIGVFGGPYTAFSLIDYPDWFPPEYGALDYGEEERPINVGIEWITGSNMVIRKALFLEYGGFDVRLGMSGSTIAYGEEIRFILTMSEQGEQVYYVPAIKVAHLVADYKMRLGWLLLSNYANGRHHEMVFNKRSLFSHVVTLAVTLGCAVLELLRPVSIPLKRRLYYALYRTCYATGAVIEHFSNTGTWNFSAKPD